MKAFKQTKEDRNAAREYKAHQKQLKQEESDRKKSAARELRVLKYMLKSGVEYHHHGRADKLTDAITSAVATLKATGRHEEYNPYIWNHQGPGKSYMPLSLLGHLWRSTAFETIYDVPLDGSYVFYAYDSGQRGLGSFHYLTAKPREVAPAVPVVAPGAFPPITC